MVRRIRDMEILMGRRIQRMCSFPEKTACGCLMEANGDLRISGRGLPRQLGSS